jgi:MFS family permease
MLSEMIRRCGLGSESGTCDAPGTSFLFTQVPSALVAPVSGAMADKLDRKRVMIICDLLGAAAYAGMAVTGSSLVLIALGSLAALLHSPFGPASRAAVPNLAGEADLAWANGTLAAASNVGQLAGPALGGVLYAAAGAGPAFGVNALSFVISAALIVAVRGRFRREARMQRQARRGRAASGRAPASCGMTQADGTGEYQGADCGHGQGATSDSGTVTWSSSGGELTISPVVLNGLGGFPATVTAPAAYGHYTGTVGSFITLPPFIPSSVGTSQLQVAH